MSIFIGGLYKSGTSLLRSMLGQHSAVFSGLETNWFKISTEKKWKEEIESQSRIFSTFFDLDKSVIKEFKLRSSCDEEFLQLLFDSLAKKHDKRLWIEKTPGNILVADRIYKYWPRAKIIQIVRDPRDVFASFRQAKKWDSPNEFANLWLKMVGNIEVEEGKRFTTIRYEDLILKTEETARSLCNFLDLPWEEEVGSFQGNPEDFKKVKEATGKSSTTLDRLSTPISNTRIGIWGEILSENEINVAETIVASAGYQNKFRSFFWESDK